MPDKTPVRFHVDGGMQHGNVTGSRHEACQHIAQDSGHLGVELPVQPCLQCLRIEVRGIFRQPGRVQIDSIRHFVQLTHGRNHPVVLSAQPADARVAEHRVGANVNAAFAGKGFQAVLPGTGPATAQLNRPLADLKSMHAAAHAIIRFQNAYRMTCAFHTPGGRQPGDPRPDHNHVCMCARHVSPPPQKGFRRRRATPATSLVATAPRSRGRPR